MWYPGPPAGSASPGGGTGRSHRRISIPKQRELKDPTTGGHIKKLKIATINIKSDTHRYILLLWHRMTKI